MVTGGPMDAVRRIKNLHFMTYANDGDEVWKKNPICDHCGQQWPCPTIVAVEGD